MKFKMEADALANHGKDSQGNNDDLRTLVKNLLDAAEPLSNQFNGPAKAAFNKFKANGDVVAENLTSAHAALVGSVSDQNKAFVDFQDNAAQDTASAANSQTYTDLGWKR